jgi:hypothetical protein
MMPKRRRTRAKERAYRIATERAQNHQARHAEAAAAGPAPPNEPPPF